MKKIEEPSSHSDVSDVGGFFKRHGSSWIGAIRKGQGLLRSVPLTILPVPEGQRILAGGETTGIAAFIIIAPRMGRRTSIHQRYLSSYSTSLCFKNSMYSS